MRDIANAIIRAFIEISIMSWAIWYSGFNDHQTIGIMILALVISESRIKLRFIKTGSKPVSKED